MFETAGLIVGGSPPELSNSASCRRRRRLSCRCPSLVPTSSEVQGLPLFEKHAGGIWIVRVHSNISLHGRQACILDHANMHCTARRQFQALVTNVDARHMGDRQARSHLRSEINLPQSVPGGYWKTCCRN